MLDNRDTGGRDCGKAYKRKPDHSHVTPWGWEVGKEGEQFDFLEYW